MAVEVDSVIVDLEARLGTYRTNMREAIALQKEYQQGWSKPGNDNGMGVVAQEAKRAAGDTAQAEEQSAIRKTRAKKTVSDADKAAAEVAKKAAKDRKDAAASVAKAEADAAKAATRATKEREEAERRLAVASRQATRQQIEDLERLKAVEREATNQARANTFLTGGGNKAGSARSSADVFKAGFAAEAAGGETAVQRAERLRAATAGTIYHDPRVQPAAGGGSIGAETPRLGVSPIPPREFAAEVAAVKEEAVAEREINHLMADQATLQAGLTVARGTERDIIRDQITELRLYNSLIRAGFTELEATEQVEKRMLAIEAERAAIAKKQTATQVGQFGVGAGLGKFGGVSAAGAGIAAAAALAGGVAAVASSLDFAKEIKNTADAVGLTTKQVQVYEAAARAAGVSTDQFRSGIGQLSSYLGRAKEGDEQAAKTFKALGVNIKEAGSAGDILPTLIERISSIADPAQRAAVETRLFGEEGRRLDALLGGGNQKIGELADALERTGAILSSSDIAKLNDTENKLAGVKAQLQVDLAQVVAGNADAILKLADAFASVADAAGKAFTAYENFTKSDFGKVASLVSNPLTAPYKIGSAIGGALGYATGTSTPPKSNSLSALSDSASEFLKSQPGKVGDLSKLFAPKGPKGKSADALAAEAEARTKRFNDQLAGYQDEQLRAQAAGTGSIREQASIEQQLAETAAQRQRDDINSQRDINIHHGANAELENARAKILREAIDAATEAESKNRDQQVAADLSKQQNDHLQTRLSIEAELLDGAQASARTSADRLAVQLRLLEIEKEQEKAALQNQIDTAKAGTDLTDVRARLGSIDQRYAGKETAAQEQNLSPGQTYLRSLSPTSDDVQDKEVAALDRFNQGLDDAVTKSLHLHGIFGDIVKDLIDMAIKQALIKPLAGALFGGGTSGGGGGLSVGGLGGLFGKIGGLFGGGSPALSVSSFDALPGLAGGGSFEVGGNGGIDRNLLSINGKPIIRVNQGETIGVIPKDIGSANGRVTSSGQPLNLHQTIHIDGRNSVTPGDFAQQIIQVSADHANRVAAQAGAGAVKASPARVRQSQVLGD